MTTTASAENSEEIPWAPTRDEARRRLDAFVPLAGRAYAASRNLDLGPGRHRNVSRLSPYVRARLVTEPEVLSAVLERHTPSAAYKFVSEVFWRTYWKGWLEARPAVWRDYLAAVDARAAEIDADDARRRALAAAEAGETGIAPFDAWAGELVASGYLHNHARMWFASIWIFTLALPWELGADFFMRHLLCGDPASNTLSWRWVAGLHTRGKTYLARPSNIARYTEGRFEATAGLATRAPALDGPSYAIEREASVPLDRPRGPALLVLHDDDCGFESLGLGDADVHGTYGIVAAEARSPRGLARGAAAFARGAVADAVARAPHGAVETPFDGGATRRASDALATAAAAAGTRTILAPFAPVGPVRDALDALRGELATRDLTLAEIGRPYDAFAYPHATRGFFALRTKIPNVLEQLGISDARLDFEGGPDDA